MTFVSENYFVEDGFPQVFVNVDNCEEIAYPHTIGYRRAQFCLKKRRGLHTQVIDGVNEWETQGNILGASLRDLKIFPWTDQGYLYDFDGTDITELASGKTYDDEVIPHTISLSYLSTRFPNDSTEYTAAGNNGSNDQIELNEPATNDMVGKYVYLVRDTGQASAGFQWRKITAVDETTDVISLESALDAPLGSGNVLHLYEKIEAQTWYPQLKRTSSKEEIVAYTSSGQIHHWYFPATKKIVEFDNRIVTLSGDGLAIRFSNSESYEIIDLDFQPISLSREATDLVVFSGYLMVFFRDTIGVIKSDINPVDGSKSYTYYPDLLSFGLYSDRSYLVDGGNFYVFSSDNQLEGISVSESASGRIILTPQQQAIEMSPFFDSMSGGEVLFYKGPSEIRMVHKKASDTDVYHFSTVSGNWKRHTHIGFTGNFYPFFRTISANQFLSYNNQICQLRGLTDLGNIIKQQITIFVPFSDPTKIKRLSAMKIRIGFDGSQIGGKVKTRSGNVTYVKQEVDLTDVENIQVINEQVQGDGTIGAGLLGSYFIGGNPGEGEILENFSEYIDIPIAVNMMSSHAKIFIENEEIDKQLVFVGLVPIFQEVGDLRTAHVKNAL